MTMKTLYCVSRANGWVASTTLIDTEALIPDPNDSRTFTIAGMKDTWFYTDVAQAYAEAEYLRKHMDIEDEREAQRIKDQAQREEAKRQAKRDETERKRQERIAKQSARDRTSDERVDLWRTKHHYNKGTIEPVQGFRTPRGRLYVLIHDEEITLRKEQRFRDVEWHEAVRGDSGQYFESEAAARRYIGPERAQSNYTKTGPFIDLDGIKAMISRLKAQESMSSKDKTELRRIISQNHPDKNAQGDLDLYQRAVQELDRRR